MCGIAGIVGDSSGLDGNAMLAALAHRGPDQMGSLTPHPSIWLGATRLAISDLSAAGNQPMQTADGELTVVFNGEIYNAPTLRHELSSRGHPFRSRADTEVLLHGYREWGFGLCDRVEGMFAFAIFDQAKRALFLARDPLGQKPLWFVEREGSFVFASEVRALLACKAVGRSMRRQSIGSYLATGSVCEPHALVSGVQALEPGQRRWQPIDGVSISKRYYSLPESDPNQDFASSAEEVRQALEPAVGRTLDADVPVGLLLSGGMDSTALALLSRKAQIETFHVRLGKAAAGRAERLAQSLGLKHHEIGLSVDEARASLPKILSAQDQPSVDGLNTYFVARAIREAGLKVALSGLGADELFLGYRRHRTFMQLRPLLSSPLVHRTLGNLVGQIASSWRQDKLAELVGTTDPVELYTVSRCLFPQRWVEALLPGCRRHIDHGFWSSDLSHLDLSNYLVDTLLRETDLMSMAHGVELRVPFLERTVVKAVLTLDEKLRVRRRQKKALLLAALEPLQKEPAATAPKEGFELPLEQWLQSRLGDEVKMTLFDRGALERTGLVGDEVAAVWKRFVRHADRPSAMRVWALYSLLGWAERHQMSC